jgi:RNA polymerase sigma-70 factor (ECF subfamily)
MDRMAADDATIMQAVKRGEVEQFDLLVERYQLPLIRVAASKLGNAAWAEDVVQETFLAVFAARETYNPQFAFRTWLWTILLNLCRRQLKHQHRQPRQVPRSQLPADGSSLAAGEPVEWETGLSRLLQLERREQLSALLNELPEPQGDALRLRFFGGLKFSEIAEAMNSSISGAKRRVQNGLLALAARLQQEELAEETHPAGCLLPEPDTKGNRNEL